MNFSRTWFQRSSTLIQAVGISLILMGGARAAFGAAQICHMDLVHTGPNTFRAAIQSSRSGTDKYCPELCTIYINTPCHSHVRTELGIDYVYCSCDGAVANDCKPGFHSDGTGDGSVGSARCIRDGCLPSKECTDLFDENQKLICDCR